MPDFRGPKNKDIATDDTLVRKRMELERHKARSDPNRLVGTMLAERYMIFDIIGEGGMGTIYFAEDTKISKKVAIKVLPKDLVRMPNVAARFVQEAKVATKIDHENVIDVTDLGTTPDGVPFFVMEYLKGSDLYKAVGPGGLSWSRKTADIVFQICRALSAAHEKGIIHRDMKPENVFLVERSDGGVFIKVLDFGIAKILEQAQVLEVQEDGSVEIKHDRITHAGMVLGTPAYMAPEQARGEEIDHRVDVYAVGTILYEMVCGCVPFDAEGFEGMARARIILDMQRGPEEPLPPSRRNPAARVPPELEAVIMRAIKKDPAQRFQSMKEMEEAIAALQVPEEPRANSRSLGEGIRLGSRSIIGYLEMRNAERARSMRKRRIAMAATLAIAAAAASITAYRFYPEIIDMFFPAHRVELRETDHEQD
jgi:serine/threonine-protein kinase